MGDPGWPQPHGSAKTRHLRWLDAQQARWAQWSSSASDNKMVNEKVSTGPLGKGVGLPAGDLRLKVTAALSGGFLSCGETNQDVGHSVVCSSRKPLN